MEMKFMHFITTNKRKYFSPFNSVQVNKKWLYNSFLLLFSLKTILCPLYFFLFYSNIYKKKITYVKQTAQDLLSFLNVYRYTTNQ